MNSNKLLRGYNMITIIDYGMGNLKSVHNALKHLGIPCKVSDSIKEIKNSKGIILPGVGAFPDAIRTLREKELDIVIKERCNVGVPFLGICLGMQLLFDKSYEGEECEGLGLINGEVVKLQGDIKIPHISWNSLIFNKEYKSNKILENINEGDFVYYVHSYYGKVKNQENLIAYSEYGENKIAGIVGKDNVFGTQFHPEKSGDVGLRMIKSFGEMVK